MLRSMQSTGNKHQPIMQTRLCPTRSKNSYGQQRDNSDFECEVDARIAGHSHTERIGLLFTDTHFLRKLHSHNHPKNEKQTERQMASGEKERTSENRDLRGSCKKRKCCTMGVAPLLQVFCTLKNLHPPLSFRRDTHQHCPLIYDTDEQFFAL